MPLYPSRLCNHSLKPCCAAVWTSAFCIETHIINNQWRLDIFQSLQIIGSFISLRIQIIPLHLTSSYFCADISSMIIPYIPRCLRNDLDSFEMVLISKRTCWKIWHSCWLLFLFFSTTGCPGEPTRAPKPSSRSTKRQRLKSRRSRGECSSSFSPRTARDGQVSPP